MCSGDPKITISLTSIAAVVNSCVDLFREMRHALILDLLVVVAVVLVVVAAVALVVAGACTLAPGTCTHSAGGGCVSTHQTLVTFPICQPCLLMPFHFTMTVLPKRCSSRHSMSVGVTFHKAVASLLVKPRVSLRSFSSPGHSLKPSGRKDEETAGS